MRRLNETIIIGIGIDQVSVKVCKITGSRQVYLKIDAPEHIKTDHEESEIMRQLDETIHIYMGEDQIKIKVCKIIGGQAHLGIKAPKHIKIDRLEIRNKKVNNPL